jgi:hypothetical protein
MTLERRLFKERVKRLEVEQSPLLHMTRVDLLENVALCTQGVDSHDVAFSSC